MDAAPYLQEIAEHLTTLGLDAVLIGNAAAALQGAPVTTVDIDFLFRKTPANLTKLRKLAKAMGLVIYNPFYPAAQMFRLSRDSDHLQLDFCLRIDGIRSYESLRSRASSVTFGSHRILVASLADIIQSKRAADPPQDVAILTTGRTLMPKSQSTEKQNPEHMRSAMIDAWLALPPERRTNFLRRRVGIASTAL